MRLFPSTLIISTLVMTLSSTGAQEDLDTPIPGVSARLAEEFIRAARKATVSDPLDTRAIMAAVSLVKEASKLSPQNSSILRALAEVAQMADLPDLKKETIQKLLAVSPEETSLQLARLRDAIKGANTVDQRISVYEQLLTDGKGAQLDSRIASRISFDAALLQRRAGNTDQFARWLAESVALDPANQEAMVLAAGFFGDETTDHLSRVELLSAAMLSNIQDTTLQVSLAEFLVAYGDYKDANAIYQIILGSSAGDDSKISDGLLADIVLCQWAAGDGVGALDNIITRQISVDKKYREQTRQQQPRLTPLELARIHAPLVPKLSTARAAIYADQNNQSITRSSLDSAIGSIVAVANLYKEYGQQSIKKVIELYLQAAWISVWLGNDVDSVQLLIDSIEQGSVIDPTEKTRLDGWMLLKKGELEAAIKTLSLIPDDAQAQAGLGLAYLQQNKKSEAAKLFLNIAKNQSETMLGVWSRNQLKNIVGREFDIRPEVADLNQLMVGVLQTMNDYVSDPRQSIGILINPSLQTFNPYEPINIDIELTNNTSLPLSISKNGPIHPVVLLEAQVQTPNSPAPTKKPIIIPINRQISIMPKETLIIGVDLRQYWVGGVLNLSPITGASLKLRATVNFSARETVDMRRQPVIVYEEGALGSTHSLDGLRVNGVRLNDAWLTRAILKASNVKTIEDLTSLVLLTWVSGDDVTFSIEEPLITPPPGEESIPEKNGDRLKLQDDAIVTVLTAFPSLDAVSQSWVISTMSNDPSFEATTAMLKDPQSTLSQLSWIIRFLHPDVPDEALDNPKLLDAMKSDNVTVKTVALWVYSEIQQVAKQREAKQLSSP